MKHLLIIAFFSCLCWEAYGADVITRIVPSSFQETSTLATCVGFDGTDASRCIGGYRILEGIDSNTAIFIGGRNEIVAVDRSNSTNFYNEKVGTCFSRSLVACCRITSTNKYDDCANYIRGAFQLMNGTSKLYVCGTNSLLPRCFSCNYTVSPIEVRCTFESNTKNATTLECLSNMPDASNIIPSLGTVNASAIYVETMNKLLFGVATDPRSKTHVEIASNSLNPTDGSLGSDRVTTRVNNEREVFDADFVGLPFQRNDRTYFIFRETAAEYADQVQDQNVGNEIYSRIARVCSEDVGVLVGTAQIWTSYQKIRLECAEENPTGYLNYFNEIQDFTKVTVEGHIIIHAIFSSARNGPTRSAVCSYNLTYIDEIFDNSDFFGPNTAITNPEWAVPTVPTPRPGLNCSNPSSNTDFTRDYPLMETHAKNNEIDQSATGVKPPFLVINNRIFSSLILSSGSYYIATESGSIIRVCSTDTTRKRITEYNVLNGTAIKDIEKTNDEGECFVVTTAQNVFRTCLNRESYKFPSEDEIRVRPNTYAVLTYACHSCSGYPTVKYVGNGSAVDGPEVDSRFIRIELLSNVPTTKKIEIRVFGNITVSFTDCAPETPIKDTRINTYYGYTSWEFDERKQEWNTTRLRALRLRTKQNMTKTVNVNELDGYLTQCDNCT